MDGIKRYIRIEVPTEDETFEIGKKIHEQLVGNKDYANSNIVLNVDLEPRAVQLCFYDACEDIPEISI